MLGTANKIGPFDDTAVQLEAPMRLPALRFQCGALVCRQLQCGAIIDTRATTGFLALAAALQFVGCFVTGVEPPFRLQFLHQCVVARKALGLPFHARGMDAEP